MLALVSACRRSEMPEPGKSPIELTAGVAGDTPAVTKAILSTGTGSSFESGTSLYMVLMSEKDNQNPLFSRTIGFTEASVVRFASAYGRFWEDSYSRNSQLSVYAACVPDYYLETSVNEGADPAGTIDATTWMVGGSSEYDNTWKADAGSTTLAWPLRSASAGHQTGTFPVSQDLCFSNNITADNRVTFDNTLKKFGSGKLIFNHALSKITFRIKMGEGFQSQDPFAFSNENENIVLKNCILGGTFDIEEGAFTSTDEVSTLAELSDRGADGVYKHVLDGLVVPGTNLDDDTIDGLNFTIDNNLYHLKKSMLMDALSGKLLADGTTPALDEGKLRPGVHYIFDMTVGKKKMDSFTASVVPWESVTAAETTPSNARIKVSLLDNGEPQTGENASFDLYRAANESESISDVFESFAWNTGYEGPATLVEGESGVYAATDWYWPNNKTFYHFRAVMPTGHTVTEDAVNGDYMTLTGADAYTDVCWGAPFTQDGKISKAIGPTKSTINLVLTHMMSEVTINLTTTTGNDQVDVTGALMAMNSIYPTARVRMGSGAVNYPADAATVANGNAVPWTHGFVPQSLENTVLTITTADDNQYRVSMKDVLADGNNKPISEWKPGHKYTYTFKLAKTGITQMSATLKDWVEVTGGNDNVQIQ